MSWKLTVRALAEEDLLATQRWYNEQRAGLGDEFRMIIDSLVRRILETPRLNPEVYRQVRGRW